MSDEPPKRTPSKALLLLCGCSFLVGCHGTDPSGGISELDAALSESVDTVVEISWESGLPGDSWVEFGLDDGRVRSTPVVLDESGVHRARLLGLPAYSTVYYEVFTDQGDALVSERGEIMTGGIPAGFPDLEVLVHAPEAVSSEPYMLVGLLGDESYIAALDRSGEVLWCLQVPLGEHRMLPMSVAREPGGAGLQVGNFFMDFITLITADEPPSSELVTFDLSGDKQGKLDLGVAHHEVVQMPDGSVATLGIDVRDWYDPDREEIVSVMGDTVVLVEPDGSRSVLFDTWDWRDPEVHGRFYQVSEDHGDWTHGNGLVYVPETDTILLSLALVDTILELDRQTGEVLREFGPRGYAAEPGSAFIYQHGPHWTEDGTLLMSSWVGQDSRVMAIEYEVDDDGEKLREVWSYGRNEGFTSIAGGQALRLENGNTLLNTGYRGLLVEVSPAGEPVWELSSSMGHVFVSLSFFDDFYLGI